GVNRTGDAICRTNGTYEYATQLRIPKENVLRTMEENVEELEESVENTISSGDAVYSRSQADDILDAIHEWLDEQRGGGG
ncbi:MAG: hypothetical protein CME26_16125, partial [Gemmatimonadetes bacterium]|nr:hypothetical protein [Gemmatimonadota bacterium]